jgi:2-haloacid dehalogenase
MPASGAVQSVEAVVFDLGGVLIDWNPRHLYRKLFDDEAAMEDFLDTVCTLEWHAAHDRGVPFERSCAQLAARHPAHAELIWAWARRSEEMVAGAIEGSVGILRELLARGMPCYALTNMEAETYPLRRERFPFMSWFKGTMVSAHEGIIKPEPAIFLRLLERFGLRAATTLLIDDSEPNIVAARVLGLQAVRFRSPPQLRAWLADAGLL